jgi:hypothetical protein
MTTPYAQSCNATSEPSIRPGDDDVYTTESPATKIASDHNGHADGLWGPAGISFMLFFSCVSLSTVISTETAAIDISGRPGSVRMKPLIVLAIALFSMGLYAAGEPDWCEVEKNYPMERRGIACLESCVQWRSADDVDVSEPNCGPEKYASYTFKDVEYQGEKLVCIVSVKCVSSGGP